MLFSCTCSAFARESNVGRKNFESFQSFKNRMDGLTPNQLPVVHINNTSVVEGLPRLNILLYDGEIVNEDIIGELARRSAQKYKFIVQLLRHGNYICYVDNIQAVF